MSGQSLLSAESDILFVSSKNMVNSHFMAALLLFHLCDILESRQNCLHLADGKLSCYTAFRGQEKRQSWDCVLLFCV